MKVSPARRVCQVRQYGGKTIPGYQAIAEWRSSRSACCSVLEKCLTRAAIVRGGLFSGVTSVLILKFIVLAGFGRNEGVC